MAIVFFDIDGTLWDDGLNIPDSAKKGIKQLQANGHKAFVCTGRAMGNVKAPQLLEIGFDGFIAACGNHVEMDGEIIYENEMSQEDVRLVYDVTREFHMPVVYEGTAAQWLDKHGFEGDSYIAYIVEELKDTAIYLDECKLTDVAANKFSALVHSETDFPAIKKALEGKFEFMDHGGGVVEAAPTGTSKATGIAWLCDYLGVSREDTYAIGDSVNDLEMLEFVGHGIAMGNGMEVAKKAAEYVTTDVQHDGIKNALEHYGLI